MNKLEIKISPFLKVIKENQNITNHPYKKYFKLLPNKQTLTKEPFSICPKCKVGKMEFNSSKCVSKCDNIECNHRILTTNLTHYQKMIFNAPFTFKILCASFGVGKTFISALILITKLMSNENTILLVTAPNKTTSMNIARNTLKNFLFEDDLVIENNDKWEFKNGSQIHFLPCDDISKIKGFNATYYWAIEANEQPKEVLEQGLVRVREQSTLKFKKDADGNIIEQEVLGIKRKVIESSQRVTIFECNNDAKDILNDYILRCSEIRYTNNVPIDKYILKHQGEERLINGVAFIIDMLSNPNNDEEYLLSFLNKNEIYVFTHMFCDMFLSDHRIIKDWEKNITLELSRKDFWLVPYKPLFFISDFGETMANTTVLVIWHDIKNDIYICIDAYCEKDLPIAKHAEKILKFKQKYLSSNEFIEICHVGDCSANRKFQYTNEVSTVRDQYRNEGLDIDTSIKGLKHPEISINIVNDLIENKKLFFYWKCPIIEEFKIYFKQKTKEGQFILPYGNKRGKTFDLIDSLYMFSQLVTRNDINDYKLEDVKLQVERSKNSENNDIFSSVAIWG